MRISNTLRKCPRWSAASLPITLIIAVAAVLIQADEVMEPGDGSTISSTGEPTTTPALSNNETKESETAVARDSVQCYTCKNHHYPFDPTLELTNNKDCLQKNPKITVPCPFKTCSVWTLSATLAGQKYENTVKSCTTEEILKCYEELTGAPLEYGKCETHAKLSKKQLEIIYSGRCGDISIPSVREGAESKNQEQNPAQTRGNLADLFKYEFNYEICVCKGDLCNDYKKLHENSKNNATNSKSLIPGSIMSSCWSIMLCLITVKSQLL